MTHGDQAQSRMQSVRHHKSSFSGNKGGAVSSHNKDSGKGCDVHQGTCLQMSLWGRENAGGNRRCIPKTLALTPDPS